MSKPINDGGSAFPESYIGSDRPHQGIGGGMSLRDWFAGQALAGIMASSLDHDLSDVVAVEWAYRQADRMIAQRAKQMEVLP